KTREGLEKAGKPPNERRGVEGCRLKVEGWDLQMEMLESVYKRDRAIVLAGLVCITGLAWAYLFYDAAHMTSAGCCVALAQPQLRSWSLVDLATLFMMWAIMMAGMMIPSAAPMVLMFARFNRQRRQTDQPLLPTALFLAGYLIVWTG